MPYQTVLAPATAGNGRCLLTVLTVLVASPFPKPASPTRTCPRSCSSSLGAESPCSVPSVGKQQPRSSEPKRAFPAQVGGVSQLRHLHPVHLCTGTLGFQRPQKCYSSLGLGCRVESALVAPGGRGGLGQTFSGVKCLTHRYAE